MKESKSDKESAIYLGSSKLSGAGTTTIPAKVRQKSYMLTEDELNYFLLPNGDILIKNAAKKDLLTLGADYVVREFERILNQEGRVFYFYGNAMPYYGPAIMAAYVQMYQGKFNDGIIELAEGVEPLYKDYANDALTDNYQKSKFRPEDKKLFNELTRYKHNSPADTTASLILMNPMICMHDLKDIPKLLENTNAKIFVLSINNHYESDLESVVEEYIHVRYDENTPITVKKINVKKGTEEELSI